MTEPLFDVATLTARDVKNRLAGRHSELWKWTCIEEWHGIDYLAISAWSDSSVIGYEVKVSRSDYRRELLRPDKRADAVASCTEFYFAVPKGLLTKEELAYEESLWDDGDFQRETCPAGCTKVGRSRGIYSNGLYTPGRGTVEAKAVPVPVVLEEPRYEPWWRKADHLDDFQKLHQEQLHRERELRERGWAFIACRTCGGKGYVKGARVEREAPTLWVPRDVGLIEIDGRGCRVRRKAPKDNAARPIVAPGEMGTFARWISVRPDPRHAALRHGIHADDPMPEMAEAA